MLWYIYNLVIRLDAYESDVSKLISVSKQCPTTKLEFFTTLALR